MNLYITYQKIVTLVYLFSLDVLIIDNSAVCFLFFKLLVILCFMNDVILTLFFGYRETTNFEFQCNLYIFFIFNINCKICLFKK